ncbi:MAG: dockerin type I repeat-containing protein, partial [Clostridia bacterium]|nr:dockerin type I repeat-containing protein [Clostridia bacterium]
CMVCGELIDDEIIYAFGAHEFSDEWTIDVEPTVNTTGQMSRHCIICGATTDETEIEKVLPGDTNGDGKLNSKDLSLMKRCVAGTADPADFISWNTDINGDGKINTKDLTILKRLVSGVGN